MERKNPDRWIKDGQTLTVANCRFGTVFYATRDGQYVYLDYVDKKLAKKAGGLSPSISLFTFNKDYDAGKYCSSREV
jgi:hypothetical protein